MSARELPWWEGVIPVFDVETTGVDPAEARIVQAALILCTPRGCTLDGGVVSLCNPGVPIPAEAAAVHGITDEMVADAPGTAAVVADLLRCLASVQALGWPLAIYNAPYDWPLLHAEARRVGLGPVPDLPILDPLVLDRGYDRFRRGSRKLEDTARHYGVELLGAHDASADAHATADLLRAMARRYPEIAEMGLAALQDVQRDMHAAWVRGFNEYRARKGEPPIPDVCWPGITMEVAAS